MNLPKFSVNNPVLANMLMLIIFIAGVYTVYTIPKEAMPQIEMGRFIVTVSYPGVAAEEIEKLIIDEIEDELDDITDIDYIRSTAYEGRAQMTIYLNDNAVIDDAWDDVVKELDKVKGLPEDASDPEIQNMSTSELRSVCTIAVEGETYTPHALKQISENIQDDLGSIEYVSKVELTGAKEREIRIEVDKTKMEYFNISFSDIQNAVSMKNMNLPGGSIIAGKSEVLVRTVGEFNSVDEIEFVILRTFDNGNVLRVRDVAKVIDTYEDIDVLTRLDGKESVNLYVYQNTEGNILDIVKNIRKYIKTIPDKYDDINAKIVNDESIEVQNNISTLSSSAILGVILVFITLLIFIGWRNAIFAAMGIPFTFMMTFWLMNFMDVTINNLSLFALVLILGMVVDDAIVVIENVHRNIEEGLSNKEAAIKGTKEVLWPVTAAVLTTVSAFMPLLLMDGNMGKFLSVFPKVVSLALFASLFEALFILPSHLADFSKPHNEKLKAKTESGFYRRFKDKYGKVLIGFLKRRSLSLTAVSLALILSVGTVVLGLVQFEFFPKGTPATLTIKAETFAGTRLEKTDSLTVLVENYIMELPYNDNFKSLNTNVGQMQEHITWDESSNYIEMRLDLIEADDLTIEVSTIKQDITKFIKTIPEIVSFSFSTGTHGPPTGEDVELRIYGDDLTKLNELADDVKSKLSNIKGVYEIEDDFDAGKKELRIYPYYEKLSLYGLTVGELAAYVRTASTGIVITEYSENSKEYNIRLKMADAQFETIKDVENLKIVTKTGKKIILKDVADFVFVNNISKIQRRDGKRTVSITASTDEYDENGETKTRTPDEVNVMLFGNKVQNVTGILEDFDKDHPGYKIEVGGMSDQRAKSFSSLGRAFIIAVILIYMILGTQFKSYITPFVVMATIPFAFIGVIAGLFLTNTPFSMLSFIAVVALAGIVVNDSIVFVDFIRQEREKGVDRWNSLINAGKTRLRPILLTSITTIFGLMPMMLSQSDSVATWKPMAVSISFGLAFATILTLLVLPVVYSLVDGLTCKVTGKKGITLNEALEIRVEKGYDK
ncbi:MAG: efflux RND transporter permease subunit [Candidatus Delongbacteria bacterium]|jgi:multidrug efflux pump|nr:efflux RND transporter permease subunit [Candidatus Delongbacteria bacterium]